jgi:hypothetical protein
LPTPDPSTLSSSDVGEPDFAALRARASRRRAMILGVSAVLVALGATAAVVSSQRSTRKELESSVADLRACLLGGPLEPKETPGLRFRRLQLRAMIRTDAERATGGNNVWPLKCRTLAGRAIDQLKASASESDLKKLTAVIDLLGDGGAVSKDASTIVDDAISMLDAAYASPIPAPAEPLPPVARNVDSLAGVTGLSKQGLTHAFTEDNPGLSLPVLIDEEEASAPLFCLFRASGESAECRALVELTKVHGHGLRLLGTSDPDAANLIFAGKRGSEGVFVTGSADPIDRMYSYGGYSSREKTTSVLGWDESTRTLILTQKIGAAAPSRTPLHPNFRVGNYFYGSQLLWDQVLVRGVTPNNERRLFVLSLAQKDKRSFGLVDIGELPEPGLIREGEEDQSHLTGCRTAKATVVRVRGESNDFLTFRINGTFSRPVTASNIGVLGCYGTTATVVEVTRQGGGSARIFHDTCTSAGCTRATINPESLDGNSPDLRPRPSGDVAAVDVDGKLLVVWQAGDRGGLRMRMGEPDKFAHSEATLVLDDRIENGKAGGESTLLGFRLYSREHFAVLLLSTMAGVHALRISPTGTIEPWDLKLAN